MKKAIVLVSGSSLVALLAALCAGCQRDEVKMIDVPRKVARTTLTCRSITSAALPDPKSARNQPAGSSSVART